VSSPAALAATATLVSLAFALSTLERWLARRRRHELMWTISLFCFAAGSAAMWAGASFGWNEANFKAFYLFGAILNVPYLALGIVYLLGSRRTGDRSLAVVSLLSAFAVGWVLAAPLTGPLPAEEVPRGSEVFGAVPRVLAGVGSGLAALVLIGGAVWSAARLLRSPTSPPGAPLSSRRLAAANGLIALGTIVLSLGGLLNSVVGEMEAFALSLVVGISVIFAGFLLTNTGQPAADRLPPWIRSALDEPLPA
jgi:hypothetical protein